MKINPDNIDPRLAKAIQGCCGNPESRWYLCSYHDGFADGLDAIEQPVGSEGQDMARKILRRVKNRMEPTGPAHEYVFDAIEQPELRSPPTRSEVGVLCRSCGYVGRPDDCGCGGDMRHVPVYAEDPEPEVDPAQAEAAFVEVCQRIRAGWLPHCLGTGSWWWGRPAAENGFRVWSEGLVPSMSVVIPMTSDEVATWTATLNPHAAELASGRVQVTP